MKHTDLVYEGETLLIKGTATKVTVLDQDIWRAPDMTKNHIAVNIAGHSDGYVQWIHIASLERTTGVKSWRLA